MQLDKEKVHTFLETFIALRGKLGLKKKEMFVMFHVFSLLQRHLHLLEPQYYDILLTIILEQEIHATFFSRFVRDLNQFIVPSLKLAVESSTNRIPYLYKGFVLNWTTVSQQCHSTPEIAEVLLALIDKLYLSDEKAGNSQVDFLIKLFINFPYRERDEKGVFWKDRFLGKLHLYLQKIGFVSKQDIYYFQWPAYCSAVVHFLFYQQWMNLIFSQDQQLIYL